MTSDFSENQIVFFYETCELFMKITNFNMPLSITETVSENKVHLGNQIGIYCKDNNSSVDLVKIGC